MYYYLKPDDIIKRGDEWTYGSDDRWRECTNSVGYISKDYARGLISPALWQVRRKIKQTKLGNIL